MFKIVRAWNNVPKPILSVKIHRRKGLVRKEPSLWCILTVPLFGVQFFKN